MKLKVSIQNFQSMGNAELEFNTGINGIIGPSNSGKSALLRAIKASLSNPSGSKRYIKHGTKQSKVILDVEGYPTIHWGRTDKESAYKIGDEVYQKTGKTSAFELANSDFGLVIDEKGGIVNIQGEWDHLFPFGRTDSELFKIFEDMFPVSDSAKIFSHIKNDDDLNNKEILNIQTKMQVNESKIELIEEFIETTDETDLHNKITTLTEADRVISSYDTAIFELSHLQRKIDQTEDIEVKEFDLSAITDLLSLENDMNSLDKYSKVKDLAIDVKEFNLDIFSQYLSLIEDMKFIEKNQKIMDIDIQVRDLDLTIFSQYLTLLKDMEETKKYISEYKKYSTELTLIGKEQKEIEKKLSKVEICPTCNRPLLDEDKCKGDKNV